MFSVEKSSRELSARLGITRFTTDAFKAISTGVIGFWLLYKIVLDFDGSTLGHHENATGHLLLAATILGLPLFFSATPRIVVPKTQLYAWIVFWAVAIAACTFAVAPGTSFARLQLYYAVFVFGLAFRVWLSNSSSIVWSTKALMLALAAVHGVMLLTTLAAWSQVDPATPLDRYWIPYHSNIRHLGYHGMVAASCGLMICLGGGRLRLVGGLLCLFALFGLMYFGSRGAIVAWIISAVAASFLLPQPRRNLAISLMCMVAAASLAYGADTYWKTAPLGSTFGRLQTLEGMLDGSGRIAIWKQALEAVYVRPLLGYGPEGYLTSRCCVAAVTQVHNAVLQILLECGVIGLVGVVFLCIRTIGPNVKRLQRASTKGGLTWKDACTSSVLAGFIAYSMVDGLIYHVVPLTILAMLLPAWNAVARRTDDDADANRFL